MGFGKTLFGWGSFGGLDPGVGPVLASANPADGSVIAVSTRQLRARIGAEPEGIGIDIDSMEITINGDLVYGLGADPGQPSAVAWLPLYANSYFYPYEDGSYMCVFNRATDWAYSTAYTILFYVTDNNDTGDGV